MKYALSIAALVLVISQQRTTLAQGPGDLVKQAVAAVGDAELRSVKGLAIKGDAKFWEPGQSLVAGAEPRFLGDATFTVTWDLANNRARTAWDRDQKYPDPPVKLKYTETVLPTLGYVTDEKSSQAMSGIRVAAHQRELERASPLLLVKAMNEPAKVRAAGSQRLGQQSLPAVSYTDGPTTFTILFDPKTHLPAAIRTRDDDNINGDSNFDLMLADWKPVGRVQIAHSLSYRVNDVEVAKLTYREVSANPTLTADTYAVPDAVKASAKPPATKDVPYQWVLRRLFLTRFTDSDNIIFANGAGLKLVELAPNVQHVEGGTANNLIIAMKDHLIIFDAPYGELQSRWVIDAAKMKYPGKPIRYLVLTHHHMDHTGGMRAYVAEGATVIVPDQVKSYFEQVAKTPHTLAPDALARDMKSANIIGVTDQMALKDDTVEINLHNIPNPHSDGMIIGHVVKENVVWVTDIWSPGRDASRTPGVLAVGEAVKKLGIKDATFAGGHGSTAKQDVLEKIVAQN